MFKSTPDAEAALDGEGGDDFRAVRNYYWGWFMIDKVAFVTSETHSWRHEKL